ncbi:hypothetical protein Tery_1186 [Trichodesmium erythraeum IMS101]|uniref:Zinc-ribbon domain-containing protein n=1 Tax=Trichodesmium erythraeum (strain IMS101) TaxID=203124 RepID=Q116N0_TRIEI|nr:hypothetical protein [Trichodesmium erythraeum GBRTRLIN201]
MSNCPQCQAEVNKGDNFCRNCGYALHDSLTGDKPQGFENIRETSAHAATWEHNIKEQLVQMLESFKSQLQELTQKQNNNTASLEAEREEINQINNENSKLQEELQELIQKQNNNTASLEAGREEINQINNEISKLQDELRPIKKLISLFGEWFKNNPEYLPLSTTIDPQVKLQTSTELNTTREVEEEGKYQLPLSEEEQLLKDYKDEEKRTVLSQNAITVSAATESIDNSRLGIGKSVLEKKRRGNYWILKQGSSQYLVPSDTIKINEYSIDTLKNLFECQGVNSEGSKGKFELLKPAKVSSIGEEKWQLSEPGKLEFIG